MQTVEDLSKHIDWEMSYARRAIKGLSGNSRQRRKALRQLAKKRPDLTLKRMPPLSRNGVTDLREVNGVFVPPPLTRVEAVKIATEGRAK